MPVFLYNCPHCNVPKSAPAEPTCGAVACREAEIVARRMRDRVAPKFGTVEMIRELPEAVALREAMIRYVGSRGTMAPENTKRREMEAYEAAIKLTTALLEAEKGT